MRHGGSHLRRWPGHRIGSQINERHETHRKTITREN
jgi:hypothetical protein